MEENANGTQDFFNLTSDIEVENANDNNPIEMNEGYGNEGKPEEESAKKEPEENQEVKTEEKPEEDGIDVSEAINDSNDDDGDGDNYYSRLFDNWRESGFLSENAARPEDHDLTNDELVDILKKDRLALAAEIYNNQILSKISDPETRAFLEFKMQGGRTRDFIDTYSRTEDIGNVDISDIANQTMVLRNYYARLGFDDSQIEDQIQMLRDSGKSEEYARKGLEYINKANATEREQLNKKLEAERQESEMQMKEYSMNIAGTLKNMDSVNGINLTDNRRSELYNLLTGQIDMGNGETVPAFQAKLFQIMQDPQRLVALADFINGGADFSRYEKAVETKKTREISRNLINNKSGRAGKGKPDSKSWF